MALGLLYNNVNRPEEALGELREAVKRHPKNTRALLLTAEILGGQGQPDAMEAVARQALALTPDDPEALFFLAEASLRREHFPLALEQAQAILTRYPSSTRALEVTAIARAQTGDRAGARKTCRALVAAEPDAWVHLNNFALFELQGNDFEAAARLYERAVDINPRNVVGYKGLLDAAHVLRDRKRIERAESMLAFLRARPSS